MAPKQKRLTPRNVPVESNQDLEPERDAFQPAPRNPSSSKLESESDTESDSDSEPKSRKEKPSQMQSESAVKRPAENNSGRSPDPKNAKKKKVESKSALALDDPNKKMFQRIFTDEDVVAILEGMVEFRSATEGDDPYKSADAFHDFMTKRSKGLSFEASVGQLKEKIRRMKKKFINNAWKGNDGEPPKFSKPYDKSVFELSQLIWGEGAEGEGKAGKKIADLKKEIVTENAEKQKSELKAGKGKANLESNEITNVDGRNEIGSENAERQKHEIKAGEANLESNEISLALCSFIKIDKALGVHGLGEGFLRKGDDLMEASKKAEFENKWMELEAAELELRVKRSELYAKHAEMMLQVIKESRR